MLFKTKANKESQKAGQITAWTNEINETLKLLKVNEQLFNMTDDFEMTEYAIYERIALNTRYKYLLNKVKQSREASISEGLVTTPAGGFENTGG